MADVRWMDDAGGEGRWRIAYITAEDGTEGVPWGEVQAEFVPAEGCEDAYPLDDAEAIAETVLWDYGWDTVCDEEEDPEPADACDF